MSFTVNFGSAKASIGIESKVESLMRKHEELINDIADIENQLNALVTEKVVTPYGTVEKAQSVRYDNEGLAKHLIESGMVDNETLKLFTVVDNTKLVNHFKLPSESKEPFRKLGEPKLVIKHSTRK